jgi:hypothetical protein
MGDGLSARGGSREHGDDGERGLTWRGRGRGVAAGDDGYGVAASDDGRGATTGGDGRGAAAGGDGSGVAAGGDSHDGNNDHGGHCAVDFTGARPCQQPSSGGGGGPRRRCPAARLGSVGEPARASPRASDGGAHGEG